MNLAERFDQCTQFLKVWESFLSREPIRNYPNFCPELIEDWTKELQDKKYSELSQIEKTLNLKSKFPEFNELLSQIKTIIDFPKTQINENAILIDQKIKRKKEHEIKQIKSILEDQDEFEFLDFGGGTGHLCENLIHNRNRFGFSIDLDSSFQKSGKLRIEKNDPNNLNKMEFLNLKFGEDSIPELTQRYSKQIILGLHACGDLTPDIISYFKNSQSDSLISIGCCYHKLTTKINLSERATLNLTPNAFNLAARSYAPLTPESLELKIKIRLYRYMLHCFLFELGYKKFIPTGKTRLKDYEKSFGEYAIIYAPDLVQSKTVAQAFYDKITHREIVQKIIYTDIFRGLFGRVIETYIVLDRALYLEEKGYQVEVKEIFDPHISPRNLAILAHQ
tara:strand:- start:8110 stop:9285 length:1176 start_codon:yes stop_codon:yes gene_type:complete